MILMCISIENYGLEQGSVNYGPHTKSSLPYVFIRPMSQPFTFLNGWKNFFREYFMAYEINMKFKLVSKNEVLLESTHAHGFMYYL